MRHLKSGRKLGRNPSHRMALKRNLAAALIAHEQIITTVQKAKALRPFIERLVTIAKQDTLHARRLVSARLGPVSGTEVMDKGGPKKDPEGTGRNVVQKLFDEIATRFADRPGGYTRIIRRPERRLGDGGETAYIAFLRPGEVKDKKVKQTPAPAPVAPAPAPAPEPVAETPAS